MNWCRYSPSRPRATAVTFQCALASTRSVVPNCGVRVVRIVYRYSSGSRTGTPKYLRTQTVLDEGIPGSCDDSASQSSPTGGHGLVHTTHGVSR